LNEINAAAEYDDIQILSLKNGFFWRDLEISTKGKNLTNPYQKTNLNNMKYPVLRC